MNTQTPEKQIKSDGFELMLHSLFLTIQGEGPFAGMPAIFIRLGGCNIQCKACDTEYTEGVELTNITKIISLVNEGFSEMKNSKNRLVVITGGEPFRQNIVPLINGLKAFGYTIQIETNGTLTLPDFPWSSVVVVCSPKTPRLHKDILMQVRYFKYVVKKGDVDLNNGLPNKTLSNPFKVAHVGSNKRIFIQPLDENDQEANQQNLQEAIRVCLKHNYRLCIQTHKLCNLP